MKYLSSLLLIASSLAWGTEPEKSHDPLISFVKSDKVGTSSSKQVVPVMHKQPDLKKNTLEISNGQTNPTLQALTQLQNFGVITFFPPNNKINQVAVYQSQIDSFKNIGNVIVVSDESVTDGFLQENIDCPFCFFAITKNEDLLQVSLDVMTEVEVSANHYKTACSIWKKTLYSSISSDSNPIDSAIVSLTKQLIETLGTDWKKANPSNTSQLSFRVKKLENLP